MLGTTNPIESLNNQARPRPDLLGNTTDKPITYMGRVVTQPTSVAEIMQKVPTGEMDAGGQAMGALPQEALKAAVEAGAINIAIKRASGVTEKGAILPGALTGKPWSLYRNAVLNQPGFEKFQQKVQEKIAKNLGDEFPVYRGVKPTEIEDMMQGRFQQHLPFSTDPNVAYSYTGPGGAVLEGVATPQSVLFPGAVSGAFKGEKELVINPATLKSLSVYDILGTQGNLYKPRSREEIDGLLKEFMTRKRS